MVKKQYVPERGELVWTDFSPHRGHEQAGRRPAIILSSRRFNEEIGIALCCPITSKEKGYIFEVPIETQKVQGAVLTHQVRSLDWRTRGVEFAGKASEAVVEKVGMLVAKIAQGK